MDPFSSDNSYGLFQPSAAEAMKRLMEVALGFNANETFSLEFFTNMRDTPFSLTSKDTSNTYSFLVKPESEITEQSVQVILFAINGQLVGEANWRKLTLVPAADGLIRARSGWH